MAAHVYLKNEFTEDEKYHNLMSWLKWYKHCRVDKKAMIRYFPHDFGMLSFKTAGKKLARVAIGGYASTSE